MDADRSDELERVAGAISDGTPVDWGREKAASPELSDELFHLAQLEKVGQAHGGLPVTSEAMTQSANSMGTEPVAGTDEPVPVAWDRLRVLEMVGQGSGGRVYRAFDPVLQMEVALKLRRRDPSWTKRDLTDLVEEGRRLARVRHSNVLAVHGAAVSEGWVGVWTDFVRGVSLEEYLRQSGPRDVREAAHIGLDLCRALAAVHAAGLVHRDIKASNVMRENGGRIVLGDFGSMGETAKSEGGFHGTPLTMPPEQLRGEPAGPTADVYALGVLLYRLVSGRYPIEASSFEELEARHREGAAVSLRDRRADLPLDFVAIVERAMASNPRDRFRTMGEMERALAATIGAVPATSPPRRAPWLLYLAAALVTAALVVIVIWKQQHKPEPPPPSPVSLTKPSDGALQNTPAPLTAAVTLLRKVGDQTLPLSSTGGRVEPGDGLVMEIRGNEPMYVYVLNDDGKHTTALFPVPGLSPANPLAPTILNQLPGRREDTSFHWTVTNSSSRDRIVAIASRTPLEALERVIERIPRVQPGKPIRYGDVGKETLLQLRTIGAVEPDPVPSNQTRGEFDEALQSLAHRAKDKGDVWVWEADLRGRTP
jgi:serine/threonine protein kinase